MTARRQLVLRLALLAASVACAFVGLEIAFRVYDRVRDARHDAALPPVEQRALVPSADPELIWQFNPGFTDGGFTVNSLGMADADRTPGNPRGLFRVALVGDSVTANFNLVPRADIYPTVLSELLGPGAEILNFGVQGYSIEQSLRMARTRVPVFQPDVLVVQLCLNDPYPTETPYARIPRGLPIRSATFVYRRVWPDRFWAYWFVQRNYDSRGWANVRRAMDGYREIAESGTPILLVLFPYLYDPAYTRWNFGEIHEGYRSAAASAGLAFVDLHERFRAAGLIDDQWPRDPIHPGPRGHRLAAEAIIEELDARRWLPAAGEKESP